MANPTNGGPQPEGGVPPAQTGAMPRRRRTAQYIKDFSFENPNAPRSLQSSAQQPGISIQINVNAQPLTEPDIEVELRIEGKAEVNNSVLFAFELSYAGVFRIQNVPQDSYHPI